MNNSQIQRLIGDCRELLPTLPAASVQCVVTSPPYWGLRDYKVKGQFGLEATMEEYVANMVDVFRAVRRVLRDDGTLWMNLGDVYNSGTTAVSGPSPGNTVGGYQNSEKVGRRRINAPELRPKNLVGIPWRVALALQADGWYLRSDIIWHKPNPMPESVTDRPIKAHEYVFLLSKSERYYYDAEAVREGVTETAHMRRAKNGGGQNLSHIAGVGPKSAEPGLGIKANSSFQSAVTDLVWSRNLRDVWTIATEPYKGAHFATYPRALVRPCILAGTSALGCCPKCGAPLVRVLEKPRGLVTIGWRPSCQCPEAEPVPCTVLDPFFGSGTTGQVALELGRRCLGIELSSEYADLSMDRAPLFTA